MHAGRQGAGGEASGCPAYLCKGGRSCTSLAGSGVLGMTPRMVLCNDVPLSRRLRTSCKLRAVSTLVRMVEPGSNTPSWVSSSGRRLGIWMGLTDDMATAVSTRTVRRTLNVLSQGHWSSPQTAHYGPPPGLSADASGPAPRPFPRPLG